MNNKGKKQFDMKPELLLPAGSPEAFIAALEGGADAIYLGLQNFNARGRAKNFQITQLPALIKKAHSYHAKIYLTLNTLIKNNELTKLLEYLEILKHYPPAAIIIQDWGVYYFLTKYYPMLYIHASTQMGNHNSLDCRYAGNQGYKRVILARELTLEEIHTIAARSRVELEVFTHGALCYSFSGSCLFSSWAGGMSANRGQCKQPCRHQFMVECQAERWFSMKDFELLEYLPEFTRLGIKAIKIEGRMRSADYVYTVAKAYRMALDNPERTSEAKQLLVEDGGRDKTDWFIPGKSEFSTTGNSFTGKGIGVVTSNQLDTLGIKLAEPLSTGSYLRFQTDNDSDAGAILVDKMFIKSGNNYIETTDATIGQDIYLVKPAYDIPLDSIVYKTKHISASSWQYKPENFKISMPDQSLIKQRIGNLHETIKTDKQTGSSELFFRIDDFRWVSIIKDVDPAGIILPLKVVQAGLSTLQDIECNMLFIVELPFFISENDLPEVKQHIQELLAYGFKRFCITRLAQSLWFEHETKIDLITSEKVYCLNDAAIVMLKQSGVSTWIMPFENDFPNLMSSYNREGIIPLYIHPELFYSRQAVFAEDNVRLQHHKDMLLYRKRSKTTYTLIPEKAVCNFTFWHRLKDKGYNRFLIDLNYVTPGKDYFENLMDNLKQGKNPEGTQRFNMKQGLW